MGTMDAMEAIRRTGLELWHLEISLPKMINNFEPDFALNYICNNYSKIAISLEVFVMFWKHLINCMMSECCSTLKFNKLGRSDFFPLVTPAACTQGSPTWGTVGSAPADPMHTRLQLGWHWMNDVLGSVWVSLKWNVRHLVHHLKAWHSCFLLPVPTNQWNKVPYP